MGINRSYSDAELILSLKTARDRNSGIQFLYSAYFDSLSRYIMANQGSLADAEDIFQDVVVNFIALVDADKFRGESTVKTFLFSLNRYSWLNELKRRGRASVREMNYEKGKDELETDISGLIMEKESANQLSGLLDKLGENCKKILLLFYYEQLSMKDILLQLDYENEQVVRNKKYKCLKQLEKMISDQPALATTLKNMFNG